MAKWTYVKEDLIAEISTGGDYVERSGAYDATIEKIVEKTNPTGTEQITFTFKTDEGQTATAYMVYLKADGTPIDFKVRVLNQICGLLKVTPENIDKAIGKKIGVFLKAKLSNDKKYINTELEGVYEPVKKLTTKEIAEGKKEPETYNKLVEKYGKEPELVRSTGDSSTPTATTSVTKVDSDSFPF